MLSELEKETLLLTLRKLVRNGLRRSYTRVGHD